MSEVTGETGVAAFAFTGNTGCEVGDDVGEAMERVRGMRVSVCITANLSPLHWIQSETLRTAVPLITSLGIAIESTVIDRHTTTKRDAPSATARVLGDLLPQSHQVVSERYGAPVSDHRVILTCMSEMYELSHTVRDLRLVATGALILTDQLARLENGLFTAAWLYRLYSTTRAGGI